MHLETDKGLSMSWNQKLKFELQKALGETDVANLTTEKINLLIL